VAVAADLDTIMAELAALGTAQHRDLYARHGAREPLFGVSYEQVAEIARRIGRDQDLAEGLWRTDNHDARMLATRIADPALLDAQTAERWLADTDNHVLTGALASLLARAPAARPLAQRWRERDGEWPSSAGWALTASLVLRPGALADGECARLLVTIEDRIGDAPNRTRHEMNGALIAIGARGGELEEQGRAAAQRIGRVIVDHGQTGCETPAAITWLERIAARRAARAGHV
jgi:3-methyladenine DNA glycosylase AlkD